MHLGCTGSTTGPCFTTKDYMHMVRHVTYNVYNENHHIFINHYTQRKQVKYTNIRYINNYEKNRRSIHSLFIIIILYFEYTNQVHPLTILLSAPIDI